MDDLQAVFVALVHQPAPVLKSINAFNTENPEAATAAKSVVSTITAKKKCTRRVDGWARWGLLVCVCWCAQLSESRSEWVERALCVVADHLYGVEI